MLADLIDNWNTDPVKRKWLNIYLPVLLSVLLISLIAWHIANLFWTFASPSSSTLNAPLVNKPVSSKNISSNLDLNQIKQANLFGQFQTAVAAPVVETIDAPETTLQLNLHGTLLSDNKEQSRAIIEVNGKDKIFSVGDEIQNNVSLHSVLAYQVILNNRGKKEALKLPREEESSGSIQPRNSTSSSSANRIAQDLRKTALNNPSSITDILRLKKGQTSSGQKGFRIYPGKERDRFRELGLMPGDFVTQVNGLAVADQNPFQVVQSLGSSSYINLSIERNGQPMNLSFDLGQTR